MTEQLHRCGIITGSLHCYCLPCEKFFENSRKAYCHVACAEHWDNLSTIAYLPRHEGHHIRKFKAGYFCEFCNELIPTGARVDLHVSKDEHNQNRGAYYLKSLRHGVSAFDRILVDDRAWHGLLDNLCCVCDIEIEDEVTHKTDNSHLLKLVQKPIKYGQNDDIYRQINNLLIQCLTCNKLLPLIRMDDHFVTAEHVNFKSKCIVQGNKYTHKQDAINIDNNGTDTIALNDSGDKNTDNSSNTDDFELSKTLLNAAIYHAFDLNDDIETYFYKNSDIDFKYEHNYIKKKKNIEKRTNNMISTLIDEQINFNSKCKLQSNHENQDTLKQDTKSNNINKIDITTLNDSGNKCEHDNSSNIEEFEKFKIKLHASMYRSLDIDDDTESVVCSSSESDIQHESNYFKKHNEEHENIDPSTASNVQYRAERVDFNSKCKIKANHVIQDTLKQDRNSNNVIETDKIAINDSSSKKEHVNSYSSDELELSKILAAMYHGINFNDDIKTVFSKSPEMDVNSDYDGIKQHNIEKHANIESSTSTDEQVNFKRKYKMQAGYKIEDTLKQDTNSNDINEIDMTTLNYSGNKYEHDNSSNIEEFEEYQAELQKVIYRNLDIDETEALFARNSEIDIKYDHDDIKSHIDSINAQNSAENVAHNSKCKIETNLEVQDTLKGQDINSNNNNGLDTTVLNVSGNKIEDDNSSKFEELEISKTMLHTAIHNSIDVNDKTETFICSSSESDIQRDFIDFKKHNEEHENINPSTSSNVQYRAERVDRNLKCKIEANYEIQDTLNQDRNSNNIIKTDTITLNDSGSKKEHVNSSNIEEFDLSKILLHATMYHGINLNDDIKTIFSKNTEINVKSDYDGIKPHNIAKHSNIVPSSSTDGQVYFRSKYKMQAKHEIQDTLKQDTNSKNTNEIDITTLNYSGNKFESDNSSNIEKFEISKTMLDTAIRNSIDVNDKTETFICSSSESDIQRNFIDFKKHNEEHEIIDPSTSSNVQYRAVRVDRNSSCKIEANHEIHDTLNQDRNSNNIIKTNTITLNDSGSKKEHVNSSNIEEFDLSKILLHAAMYHGININDDIKTVFSKSSEMDVKSDHDSIKQHNIEKHSNTSIVPSTSNDGRVYFRSKYKMQANHKIEDTLKQDTSSKNPNEIDITTFNDSVNKYEHDNSSSIEEFEKVQSKFHKVIYRSLDDKTKALFGRNSEIDIKHDHDDNKSHIDSNYVQNTAENVDLNSKCKVEANLEVQDTHKQDSNHNNNGRDTIALNDAVNKIEHETSSNIDKFEVSKTMLHAALYESININDNTETEFCGSSAIEIKQHENIEPSTSTDVQYPAVYVDLNSKCEIEINCEIHDTLKEDSNSNNVNETNITTLNDFGHKTEHENSSNIKKREMSKTKLCAAIYESININDDTEDKFCRSSEIEIKYDHDDIKKHIEKHENNEPSTSTDVHVYLNSKCKVEVNYEIQDTIKQDSNSNIVNETNITAHNDSGNKIEHENSSDDENELILKAILYAAICESINNDDTETEFCRSSETEIKLDHDNIKNHMEKLENSNNKNKTDTTPLNDSWSENEYANSSNIEVVPITKTMFDAMIYQSIDIHEERETIFCKACGLDVSLDQNGIENHIEEHASIGELTADVQYPERFNKNDYRDNNVKKDATANSITENQSCLRISKDNNKHLEANNEAHSSNNPRQFARDNHFTYDNDSALCRTCQVRLPFTLKSMQEHVQGGNHKRSIAAARAAHEAAAKIKGDTRLRTQPMPITLTSLKVVQSKSNDIRSGYIINKQHFIRTRSFLLYNQTVDENRDKFINCMYCGSIFKEDTNALWGHMHSCFLSLWSKSRVVTTVNEEFVREFKPGKFHCGYCHFFTSGWDEMVVHLKTLEHELIRTSACDHYEQCIKPILDGQKEWPPGFKVFNVLTQLHAFARACKRKTS